jgi:hypothetical protein
MDQENASEHRADALYAVMREIAGGPPKSRGEMGELLATLHECNVALGKLAAAQGKIVEDFAEFRRLDKEAGAAINERIVRLSEAVKAPREMGEPTEYPAHPTRHEGRN